MMTGRYVREIELVSATFSLLTSQWQVVLNQAEQLLRFNNQKIIWNFKRSLARGSFNCWNVVEWRNLSKNKVDIQQLGPLVVRLWSWFFDGRQWQMISCSDGRGCDESDLLSVNVFHVIELGQDKFRANWVTKWLRVIIIMKQTDNWFNFIWNVWTNDSANLTVKFRNLFIHLSGQWRSTWWRTRPSFAIKRNKTTHSLPSCKRINYSKSECM